jgi:hypothetical protein
MMTRLFYIFLSMMIVTLATNKKIVKENIDIVE